MKRKEYYFLLFIFLLAFLLRLPSLMEPYSYSDEGIYLVLGQSLRKGLVWYSQIHDNKPPMLYLLAATAGNVFWFRLMLLTTNFINIYLIFLLAKKFFKENLSLFITLFFAIFSTIRFFEGNIANAEVFMMMPISAAVLMIARQVTRDTQQGKIYFLSGLLFSIATLFKMPAAFDFVGICFFLIFFSGERILQSIKQVILMGIGFLMPIGATIVYYWSKEALSYYLSAAFFQNIGYLSSWGIRSQANITQSGLMQRGGILFLLLIILFLSRKKLSKNFLLIITWFFFALFGALLSERPYPHYLIQVVPALSLSIGFLFLKNHWQKLGVALSILCFLVSFFYYKFWHYKTLPYYQTFYQYLLRSKTKQDWYGYFGEHIDRTYQVAAMIKENTKPKERIFVWGTEPGIYYLSDRLPVGRYTVSYHIKDFNGWEETMKALEIYQPKFIVKLTSEAEFPQLDELLKKSYFLEKTIQDLEIYKKI